jgi:hypothetical protein
VLPPTVLLFILKMIYGHGEPRWNDDDKTKIDSFNRALLKSYQQNNQVKQEKLAKEIMNLTLRSICVHTSKGFLTCRKTLHVLGGFTYPSKEGVLQICIALIRV